MSRKITYNHTRFDGGMTHDNRDTSDLSKSSFISHLDIYRENHKAHVMPGFVSDQDYDSITDGLKTYDIQAFNSNQSDTDLFAIGKKSDGTGSKLFQRTYSESEWKDPASYTVVEGTADLVDYPFLHYDNPEFYYPVDDTDGSGVWIAELGPNAIADQDDDWATYRSVGNISSRFTLREMFDGVAYFSQTSFNDGLYSISGSGISQEKTSGLFIQDFASGDEVVGIAGINLRPRRGQTLLWDSGSSLADQNISLGNGVVVAVGYPSNLWATALISSTTDIETNGINEMIIKVLDGTSPQVVYKLNTISKIDQTTDTFSLNSDYKDSMLWYAKCEIASSTFKEGVFAFGKGGLTSSYGASMLLDTSSLGLVRNAHVNGNSMYFIHNEDGSVSRLDDFSSGTYDVDGYIETLFYGADTPNLKTFEGISVLTEDLPSGASVEVQYRIDENDSWTSLGTSSTTGDETHNFTSNSGVRIDQFREIQFKIILSGKVVLKNYLVSIVETDNLPFNV